MRPGSRWKSVVCDTEVVVIRSGKLAELSCGGHPMTETRTGPATGQVDPRFADGTVLGKRYEDATDSVEVLCTKAGVGALSVGDRPLLLKNAKPLPASD
jgi:hypothetical protein